MTTLHWNKPERVELKAGMQVSYRSVGFWFQRGEIVDFHGSTIRVKWSERITADEWTENLYVWTEKETDSRDTYNG